MIVATSGFGLKRRDRGDPSPLSSCVAESQAFGLVVNYIEPYEIQQCPCCRFAYLPGALNLSDSDDGRVAPKACKHRSSMKEYSAKLLHLWT